MVYANLLTYSTSWTAPVGKKGGIRLLRITEIPEWKLGGCSGEAADTGHYHALHVALACWVGLGFTCFSPQSCILLTTSRTLSPLLLLSEETRGKSLSYRGWLFSLAQMTVPFPHLCLRDGAPSFALSQLSFLRISASPSPTPLPVSTKQSD